MVRKRDDESRHRAVPGAEAADSVPGAEAADLVPGSSADVQHDTLHELIICDHFIEGTIYIMVSFACLLIVQCIYKCRNLCYVINQCDSHNGNGKIAMLYVLFYVH